MAVAVAVFLCLSRGSGMWFGGDGGKGKGGRVIQYTKYIGVKDEYI